MKYTPTLLLALLFAGLATAQSQPAVDYEVTSYRAYFTVASDGTYRATIEEAEKPLTR